MLELNQYSVLVGPEFLWPPQNSSEHYLIGESKRGNGAIRQSMLRNDRLLLQLQPLSNQPTLSRCPERKNRLSSAECSLASISFRGGLAMEQIRVERLDHLGVVASVIKDFGLIAMIKA